MWWLVYERCNGCEVEHCVDCLRTNRSLRLKRVFSEDMPQNALYGPRARWEDLLDPSWRLFEFNAASDELFFKVEHQEKAHE